ncbi:MAG TPA: TolC family protein [Polyangiaceae bacterium]|nr:TolC family protein [Polyangiaceae bacterium]
MNEPRFVSTWARRGLPLLLLVMGCAPSLKDNPPREANRNVPQSFGSAPPADQAKGAGSAGKKTWKSFFAEPELQALIETALTNNQELNMRMQEIIIAQNEVRARRGEYKPKLSAGVGAGVEKVGRHTSQGVSDEAHGVPENLGNFTFGLNASWEVDIWKRLRNSTQAANYRYLASIEGKNFVVTQLVAEISASYYELLALDNQLEVLNKNIAIQTNALEIVKLQKEAARVTELAVQRFEAEVLKNRSLLYELEQQRVQTENRINFLVGRYPQPVARNAAKFNEPYTNNVQAGVPTDLLDNRPDVRQAERDMKAAQLDVKVAKAGFYPALSIEAGVGYESFNIKHLVATPESLLYNLAGNLTAPLLNRNVIAAEYRSANARQLQAVFNYERTLLQAFTDVANQLAKIKNLEQSFQLRSQQVAQLTSAIEVSSTLFQSARADYMEVLLTRRDALDAQMELIETKKQQLQAMVTVYQALGGGWQ